MKKRRGFKLPSHEVVFDPKRFRRTLRFVVARHKYIKEKNPHYVMPSQDEMDQQARELM